MFARKSFVKNIVTLALCSSLLFMGASCTNTGNSAAQQAYKPVTLEYWTVFNSPEDYQQLIADYQATHPNIRINIKKFRVEEYESELVNALAEDRGPDLFSVHNTWLPNYRRKLLPLPPVTTLPYQYETGSIKKEVVTEFRSTRSIGEFELRRDYLEQVYKDVYIPELIINQNGEESYGDDVIYGLPLSFDTMVEYYNRDLLDNAGIAQPAKNWTEFQEQVGKLVKFDSQGTILTAGAALGTSQNIPRSVDILSLLMMQNGAEMISDGSVSFHRTPESLRGQRDLPPGQQALIFYSSFANSNRRFYTWNTEQSDAFEDFLQGKLAYFFGYAYHLPQIRGLAPKLNFGISTMPQIQGNGEVYFANYWVEGVSRKTQYADAAWDLVQFMASAQEAQKFTARTQKPTARRDLINTQLEDKDLFIFASQLLTSKSWYNGMDSAAMESIMKKLIDDTLVGNQEVKDLMDTAAQRVQQTLR